MFGYFFGQILKNIVDKSLLYFFSVIFQINQPIKDQMFSLIYSNQYIVTTPLTLFKPRFIIGKFNSYKLVLYTSLLLLFFFSYFLWFCYRKNIDSSKFTILLNNMRLMAIVDWWESVRDFIMTKPDYIPPGIYWLYVFS